MRDSLDLPATPARLRAALAAIGASRDEARRSFAAAGASPPAGEWLRFGSAALLLLGACLVLSGAISFFAFNWDDLGRFEKFALLEAAVAACALAAWRRLDTWVGSVALFAAAVLVGPLLGVYGQTYQTGADPWGLFAAWAAFIVPWVVAARFTALWLLLVALADVALVLFCGQTLAMAEHEWLIVCVLLGAVHTAAVVAWEWQRRRDRPWLDETWGPRLLAATGLVILMVPAVVVIFDVADAGRSGALGLLLLTATAGGALAYYRSLRRDLFMLTAAAGTLLTLISIVLGRVIFKDLDLEIAGLFLMALVVVGQVALAVAWLRRTLREWAS